MALPASTAAEEQARTHAQAQLRELRAYHLIAACLWQATATVAAVLLLHALCGTGGTLWALLLSCGVAALQAPLLHAQRALLLPAVRSSPEFATATPADAKGGLVATAYPGRAVSKWERDIFNSVWLCCVAALVGALSVVACAWLRQSSLTTDVAARAGAATGLVHAVWVLFCGGRFAPFPPLPRPRMFRVKQRLPRVMKEAAATALVALVCLGAIYVVASMRGGERQLSLHLDGVVLLALAVLLVAAAMHIGVHLLGVVYTERVRFLPPDDTVGAAAHTAPLRYALKNAQEMDDAFAQHLAYEDMCFVAEKDAHRRNAVFDDVDTKNGAWTDLVNAALKPVNAAIEAAKKSTSAADGKTRARAARELSSQQQLAVWSIRALAALGAATPSCDRFGLAQIRTPTLGEVLSRLLALHRALQKLPAPLQPAGRANFRFGAASVTVAPTPSAVLADVVATALFTLAEAFPDAALQTMLRSKADPEMLAGELAHFTLDAKQ